MVKTQENNKKEKKEQEIQLEFKKEHLDNKKELRAEFHLPGLFEFYEFYCEFLPLFGTHPEYFYDWCEIASIYGAPSDCIWGGGRVGGGDYEPEEVLHLMERYGISARLTFSNSLLQEEHLRNPRCNQLCVLFQQGQQENGVIVHSNLLLNYLKEMYPKFYFVSSTTKVLTEFSDLVKELHREEFRYVVPDFRLNKRMEQWNSLTDAEKAKVELLCNECCWFGCKDRKICYEAVSRRNLGISDEEHLCRAPHAKEGYRFSKAMENPGFVSFNDILHVYLPMGITNFKIEGRGLGSAMLLEFLLYYMVKPQYQIHVREALYLDSMLDLF